MSYIGVNDGDGWEDKPSKKTPRNAKNFNIMELGIKLAHTLIAALQAQVNQIVKTGDSSVEAAQARVKADGTAYDVLRDRLNAGDADVAKKATYYDLDTQTGTSAHFTNAEDAVVEITKIEGATTVTPADPTKDISPDNVAVITNANNFHAIVHNKNLIKSISASGSSNGITYTKNSDGSISIAGTASSTVYINLQQSDPIPYGTYTLSAGTILPNGAAFHLRLIDSGDVLTLVANHSAVTGNITTDKVIYAFITVTTGSTVNFTLYPQLEVGSSATAYEPYKSNQTSIPYEMPESDTIEIGTDGKTRRIQRKFKAVFDGSPDKEITSYDPVNGFGRFELIIAGANTQSLLCTHFKQGVQSTTSWTNPSKNGILGYENMSQYTNRIFVVYNGATDLSAFKTWLASNPITIQYKLATPVETIIDPLYLTSYPGITNVFTDVNPQVSFTANAKSQLWNDTRLIKAGQAIQQTTSNMTQTDETNDSTKYPSAAVTYALGQEIDAINEHLASVSTRPFDAVNCSTNADIVVSRSGNTVSINAEFANSSVIYATAYIIQLAAAYRPIADIKVPIFNRTTKAMVGTIKITTNGGVCCVDADIPANQFHIFNVTINV